MKLFLSFLAKNEMCLVMCWKLLSRLQKWKCRGWRPARRCGWAL